MLWNFKRKWFSIRTFSIRTLIWKLVDHAQNYKWSSHSGQYVACWLGSFSSPKNTEHLKFVYKNTLSILRKCNCYQSLVYLLYYVLFLEMGKFHVEIHLAQNYKWSSHSSQYVACWLGSFSSPKNTEHLKFVYKNTLRILRKCNCYQSLVYLLYYVLFSEMGKFHVEIHLYMRGGYNISSAPNNFTINNIN